MFQRIICAFFFLFNSAFLAIAQNNTTNDSIYNEKEVDIMPEYPGGEQALFSYIKNNIKYPKLAERDGVQGQVFIKFLITLDGNIDKIKIVKSIRDDIDAEAKRVIASMPKWKPAYKNDVPVNVELVIPLSFKLPVNSIR
jgi:protein TonB